MPSEQKLPFPSDIGANGMETSDSASTENRVGAAPQIVGSDSSRLIALSPDSVHAAGHMLFVLWLKIAVTILGALLFIHIWPVLVLIILSLMIVATFNPVVRRLQSKLTRGWAITVVVSAAFGAVLAILAAIIPPLARQAQNLVSHFPQYLNKIEHAAKGAGIPVNLQGSKLDLTSQAARIGPDSIAYALTVFSSIMGVLTVAVLTVYLLVDGPSVASSAVGLLPKRQRLHVRRLFGEIGIQVGDYIRGQLITSVLAGIFSYVILLALGVPEPLALAFLMALFDAVPMAGPLIGTVPAVLVALTKDTTTALMVLAGYVIYHQIESHILVPRIYGKTMKLSPSIIVIAILIGATLLGILGALLALPVAAAVPVIFRFVQEWRQREDEALSEDAQLA
jgi:predicted PurR-regulated permease PerM